MKRINKLVLFFFVIFMAGCASKPPSDIKPCSLISDLVFNTCGERQPVNSSYALRF